MNPSESGPQPNANQYLAVDDDLAEQHPDNRLIGTTIKDRFQLTRLIGEGGMGVVYEAFDSQVERNVAIKLVRHECRTDRKFMSRFRRELEVTSQLRHPSTIRVYDHGQSADGRPYMVMELLTGESLADRLERGPIEETEALNFARQIAESLSEAHGHGIFHRDLKPDNIFIETMGVSTVVKVLDFGIAGGLDASRLTRAGEVFGTPQYMSPEQCNGQDLDHRTDIYSLGCILYEMLEGYPPFTADSPMATMLKHVRSKVPIPRLCTRETWRILSLTLRKDRTKRIQDCGRLASILADRSNHALLETGEASSSSINRPARGDGRDPGRGHRHPGARLDPTTAPISATAAPTPPEGKAAGWVVPALAGGFALVVALLFFSDASWINTEAAARKGGKGDGDADKSGEHSQADASKAGASGNTDAPDSAQKDFALNRAWIKANVRSARVHLDGVYQCETPCEIQVPVGDRKEHEIRLEKEGYIPVIGKWQPTSVTEPAPEFPNLRRPRRK